MLFAVAFAIMAQVTDPACEALLSRLESVDPRDPAALLTLGAECETRGCIRLARSAYERILKLGLPPETPESCEAAFRLARLEMQARRYDAAFARLRKVTAECPEHEPARSLLGSAETEKTREQLLAFEKGEAAFGAGKYSEALTHYERAYALAPASETDSPYVPRSAVLARIAECRTRLDDEKYKREYLPSDRSVEVCPVCKNSAIKGFVPCPGCGGTGKVEVPKQGSMLTGRSREKVLEPCPQCNGHGYHGCGECYALGYVAVQITPKERKALRDLALSVSEPRVFDKNLAGALAEVEEALLAIKEGAALNYLRAMKPAYALSGSIRKALGAISVGLKPSGQAEAEWTKAQADKRAKINFLLNYACEFAQYLRHFEFLRGNRKPIPRGWNAPGRWTGTPISPELLAAFPEETQGEAVAVEGSFEGYSDGGAGEHKGYLKLSGAIPHNVVFFVWLPSAKPHLERLSKTSWKRCVEGLADSYPFEISTAASRAPKDHRVLAVGRLLRDPFGYPRNWFEIWRLEVGLSNSQAEALRALREPVDLSLPARTPGEIARLFRDWFDLEIQFDAVFEKDTVACSARECPLGLIVDAIVHGALETEWYFQGGKVIVCAPGEKPPNSDAAVVVEQLKALREKGSWVLASKGSSERAEALSIPEDPAGLRVAARQAVLEMRYDVAERCFEALGRTVHLSERERELVEAARAKMRLFHRLTGRTPVSRLAGAQELADVIYQRPSGDLVRQTVILSRSGELWTVQEAYGASFRIRPELVKRIQPISPADWRRRRAEELERREAQLEGTNPRELPLRLFLLALYAKTNGFPAKGAGYLDRAAELEGFPDFVLKFFPEESPAESTGEPAGDGLWGEARRYASAASACVRKVLEAEDAATWRAKAIQNLERAEEAATRLLEEHPSDPDVLRFQNEIQALKKACLEDLGFFE